MLRSSMCWEWKSLRSCEGDKRSRLGWRGELLMFGYHRFWRCLNFIIFYHVFITIISSYFILYVLDTGIHTSYLRRLREVLDTPEPESTTAATPSAQEVGFCLKSSRTCVVFFNIKLPSKYKGELDMFFEPEKNKHTYSWVFVMFQYFGFLGTHVHMSLFDHVKLRHCDRPMTFRSALWISLRSNCWGNLRRRRSGIACSVRKQFENKLKFLKWNS